MKNRQEMNTTWKGPDGKEKKEEGVGGTPPPRGQPRREVLPLRFPTLNQMRYYALSRSTRIANLTRSRPSPKDLHQARHDSNMRSTVSPRLAYALLHPYAITRTLSSLARYLHLSRHTVLYWHLGRRRLSCLLYERIRGIGMLPATGHRGAAKKERQKKTALAREGARADRDWYEARYQRTLARLKH